MELHTCLWNDVDAFSFRENDLHPLTKHYPTLQIRIHQNVNSFLAVAEQADFVLTWDFKKSWYAACPKLKAIFTPAAGNDWVQGDPLKKVKLVYGRFHGRLLAESLLGALLLMNHRMPEVMHNHHHRDWDRNRLTTTRLLGNQTVLIIGFGTIGQCCARLIQQTGANVIGVRRNPDQADKNGQEIHSLSALPLLLGQADHVVLLLPGISSSDRFMNPDRLAMMKQGSYIYNFGRGNSLLSNDLLEALPRLAGAFLDVTEEEPLPPDSPLWDRSKVVITPHSSCIYSEYKPLFVDEVTGHLKTYLKPVT